LLGMLDRPEVPMAGRPLVVLIHGLTGCEDSVYILGAARHLLNLGYTVLRLNVRGAGPSRAYCGEHYHVGRTSDFRRVLWQLPDGDDPSVPIEHYREFKWDDNSWLLPVMPSTGGHVGFHGDGSDRPWCHVAIEKFLARACS